MTPYHHTYTFWLATLSSAVSLAGAAYGTAKATGIPESIAWALFALTAATAIAKRIEAPGADDTDSAGA